MSRYKILLFAVLGILFFTAAFGFVYVSLLNSDETYEKQIENSEEVKMFLQMYPESKRTLSASTETGIANATYNYSVDLPNSDYPKLNATLQVTLYIKYDLVDEKTLESKITCMTNSMRETHYGAAEYLEEQNCIQDNLKKLSLGQGVVALSASTWDRLLSLPRDDAREELQKMFDKNQKLFMDVKIEGIQDTYTIGEPLEFNIVEAGYGNPCTHPRTIISQEGKEKPHWEYWFVHSCPFFGENHPILKYMKVHSNYRKVPPITESGQYTITSYSRYNATDSKQFVVLPSDFVYDYTLSYTKRGNSTGNTSFEINLNNGTYTIAKNSDSVSGVLDSSELHKIKKLIDDSDVLRGYPNIQYEHNESCRYCIDYVMVISLGDYANSIEWQNDEPDLDDEYIPIVEKVEEIISTYGESLQK